jgi:formylglycine-generating enzyme required for sulfatase activity
MRTLKLCIVALTMLIPSCVWANDILVSTATLTGQNTIAGTNNVANFTMVRFNLSWANSWRVGTGPSNWDAAWIFVKFRIEGGTGCTAGNWQHATLSSTAGDHSITTDNGTAGAFSPTADGKGVFIYRSGNGTGSINWQQVLLRWNYGADGVLDACNVSIKVFAVETVYIPQAAFFVGDGSATNDGHLRAALTTAAFQITSENALTLGGGGAGSVGNNNRAGEQDNLDDWDNTTSKILSAAFPKGFNAFYVMKYEISQEQYVEFLNTLTAPQQLQRAPMTVVNRFWPNGGSVVNRNGVRCMTLPVGAVPGTYACDLNANGVVNEAADGQNIAIQAISSQDLMAYLDWSGLRVMTELEMEKAGRGTLPAVASEYAWGNNTLYGTAYTPIANSGAGSELPNNPSTTVGNAVTNLGATGGPMRVGIFATATSSRVTAGAGYYGVMELTGNVWELVVGIGPAAGKTYTGLHGNGALTTNGFADVDFWPGSNGNASAATPNAAPNITGSTSFAGMMFKGGSFQEAAYLRLSDRTYPGWSGMGARDPRMGGRGVRTAP